MAVQNGKAKGEELVVALLRRERALQQWCNDAQSNNEFV